MFRQKAHMDSSLSAQPQQERAAKDIAKADDARKRVDGNSLDDIALPFHDDCFAFLPQIGALRLDVECVEKFLHLDFTGDQGKPKSVRLI